MASQQEGSGEMPPDRRRKPRLAAATTTAPAAPGAPATQQQKPPSPGVRLMQRPNQQPDVSFGSTSVTNPAPGAANVSEAAGNAKPPRRARRAGMQQAVDIRTSVPALSSPQQPQQPQQQPAFQLQQAPQRQRQPAARAAQPKRQPRQQPPQAHPPQPVPQQQPQLPQSPQAAKSSAAQSLRDRVRCSTPTNCPRLRLSASCDPHTSDCEW